MPIEQKQLFFIILIAALISVLFLFPTQGATMDHRFPIIVDGSLNRAKVEIKVGNEIQIQLKEVGSTGYEWHFDLLDETLFEIIGKEKKIVKKQNDVVGLPYIAVWQLRTKHPGNSTIRMSYYRVWEGRDKAIDEFEIKVKIIP